MTPKLHIESSRCIRCGACAALAPSLFDVRGPTSRIARDPTPAERGLVEAARWICPADAVRGELEERNADASLGTEDDFLFPELALGAERVRWNLETIPWGDLDAARVSSDLRAVVREMAFSESATYSATQRFLDAFFEEDDFSRWIAVWFYEETRHPHVLLEWLRRVGDPAPADLAIKGRVSTPFMRSIVGTLVTNVISEVTAAEAYRHLARTSKEPVLAGIARLISGDEARHAASFFRFAQKRLATESPDMARRERARGLEVLQAWLGGARPATHPVAQTLERLERGADEASLDLDFAAIRARVLHVVGLLLGLSIDREADVTPLLRNLLSPSRMAQGGPS